MVKRVHPELLEVWHNGHDYRRIEQSLRAPPLLFGSLSASSLCRRTRSPGGAGKGRGARGRSATADRPPRLDRPSLPYPAPREATSVCRSTAGAAELHLGCLDLRHLAADRNVSSSTQTQTLSALLFLYRHVLRKELGALEILRPRRRRRLPVVLTKEVRAVLGGLSGQHRLVATLLYGANSTALADGAVIRTLEGS